MPHQLNLRRSRPSMRPLALCALAASLVAPLATGAPAPAGAAVADGQLATLAGADRYETAALVAHARAKELGRSTLETVFLASGTGFADALAAGPAAASVDGAILLTLQSGMPAATRQSLARLAPSQVVLVGSAASVGEAVAADVAAVLPAATITRVGGADRIETAQRIAEKWFQNAPEAIIANGWSFPDGVSGAAAGAAVGAPVLLTSRSALAAPVTARLAAAGAARATLLGSDATLAGSMEAALQAAVPGLAPRRLAGADRYATNAAVADAYFDAAQAPGAIVATGQNFPDALVASTLSAAGAPVLLSLSRCATDATRAAAERFAGSADRTITRVGGAVADGAWRTPCPAPAPPAPSSPAWDLASPSSIQVLVNKHHPLDPPSYAPADLVRVRDFGIPSLNDHSLRAEAAAHFGDMLNAARAEAGITLDMTSGYRSFSLQTQLYSGYVAELGQAGADATSARPGYSEHQTGLTADISTVGGSCALAACYAGTAGGRWLAANAWRFGYILRYPDGWTSVTGYEFEPWHYRYIGVDAARAYRDAGAPTYEHFVGSEAAPSY